MVRRLSPIIESVGLTPSRPGVVDTEEAKDVEIESLKAQLLLKKAEVIHLRVQVLDAEVAKKVHVGEMDALKQKNDLELKDVNVVASSLKSYNDGLVDQVHALETMCFGLRAQVAKLDAKILEMALHLEEKFYPHLLTTISGQRWLLTHGLKLIVVKCLNSLKYLTTLGSAISHAIEKGMQDGLSVGIDHEKADQVVLGETLCSFALSVAHSRVKKIRENVTAQRSALIEVWVPLVDPLSGENLVGTNDQEDAQGSVQRNAASFPTVEFEKEELDTTP
nr:hypothetical protein [Tanacetum cinerariifolium]